MYYWKTRLCNPKQPESVTSPVFTGKQCPLLFAPRHTQKTDVAALFKLGLVEKRQP